MRSSILAGLLLLSVTAFSQSFEFTYGGAGEETCSTVLVDNDRYVFSGHTTSVGAGSYDICILQTDTSGNIIHSTSVGSGGEDIALGACKTPTHEYVTTGYTTGFGLERPFIVKIDSSGNKVWSKYYSFSGWGEDIDALEDGSFYITGYVSQPEPDVFLIHADSSGNVLWARSFGDSLLNEGRRVIHTFDGGAILCGITHVQAGGPTDVFVVRTDAMGNVRWSNKYATPDFLNWDLGYAIREIHGGFLVGAKCYTQAFNASPNSEDVVLFWLDSAGAVTNSVAVGSTDLESVRDISISANNIALTGYTNHSGGGQTDLLFAILDSSGNLLDQAVFGGVSFETGLSVVPLGNYRYLLGGYSSSFGSGQNDMYGIKTGMFMPSCNRRNPGLSVVPINLSVNPVFAVQNLACSVQFAGMTVSYQALPYSLLCSTTGTGSHKLPAGVNVYPNPFSGIVSIDPGAGNVFRELEVYDLQGRIVYTQEIAGESRNKNVIQVDLSRLTPGLYFIRLRGASGVSLTRIIKE